jgi:NADPH-dependent glutamate synthase beta subunit-like oxidoreductase/CO/xanthine dehydrogenase FAD-binding subunit
MKRFKYLNARTIEEAVSILDSFGRKARIIAGGTDLLGQMQDNILPEYPEVIVNIKNISGLDHIRQENGLLHIGALARLEDIAKNRTVKEKFSLLSEAARSTASPHIREMGTIAGNICQSNRCWYYWVPDNRFYCMRKGGQTCYALFGDSRYHSILGVTQVNFTPCATACPASVQIPLYISRIRENNLAEAAKILLDYNPLPAVTGRVCPHYCENECNRKILDEPVSIRCVERFIGDYILSNQEIMNVPAPNPNSKRIAIVGSGPTGLSSAFYLRRMGHDITIFESMDKPGGLLIYGIPAYRLPKDVVAKQAGALQRMGVQLKLNTRIGQDIKLEDLSRSFDAVLLACGAWEERPSGIGGEQLMLSGMGFLRNTNTGSRDLPGQKVAVIGGGNVAIDVARVLKRLGAEPLVVYRRSKEEMPALREEVHKAEEEGIVIQFLTQPLEVVKEKKKIVIRCTKVKLGARDESGRPRPVPEEGSEFIMEFDAVIKALGEGPDLSILSGEYRAGIERLKNDPSTYSLRANVFAAGDFITGPSTVVQAITAGREAARRIDSYLGGSGSVLAVGHSEMGEFPQKLNSSYLRKTSREKPPEIPAEERVKRLDVEDISGLGLTSVERESNRCFNCGCVAVNSSDLAPALVALRASIKTTRRSIEAEQFFTAKADKTTVLRDDEIVVEIEVPAPAADCKGKFIKFALRKSIDFPVVNCAAAIETKEGKVTSARICLNAVYNQPFRARRAEEYINGKIIDEVNAEEAGNQIVQDTLPLSNNGYKIQIAKTLVKRVILACKQA